MQMLRVGDRAITYIAITYLVLLRAALDKVNEQMGLVKRNYVNISMYV